MRFRVCLSWMSLGLMVSLCAADSAPRQRGSLLKKLRDELNEKEAPKKSVPRKLQLSSYGAPDHFLLVKGEDSAGSAFVAELWKTPLIVTNAHVYLTTRNPRLIDINNHSYHVTEILAAKERDLVLLAFEPKKGGGVPPLKVTADAGRIALNTPVVAFGNALGDGVITSSSGLLAGIGARIVEVTAPIVPGNSGGPVFVQGTKEVIGVSTFLRVIPQTVTISGSKFEAREFKPVVRRFATRIDNLSPGEFESIDPEKIGDEIEAVRRIEKQMEKIYAALESFRFDENSFRHEMNVTGNLIHQELKRKWQSSFMRRRVEEYDRVLRMFGENLSGVFPFDQLLRRHRGEFSVSRLGALRPKCFHCQGYREIVVYKPNPNFAPGRLEPRQNASKQTCPTCDGTGQKILRPAGWLFIPEGKLLGEIQRRFAPDGSRFAELPLGIGFRELRRRFPWYGSKSRLLGSYVNGTGYTYFYRGHHENPNASATILEYRFGKLTGVSVVMPAKRSEYMEARIWGSGAQRDWFQQFAVPLTGKDIRITLRVDPITTPSDVPVTPDGKPLLAAVPFKDQDGVVQDDYFGVVFTLRHPEVKMLDSVNFADFITE